MNSFETIEVMTIRNIVNNRIGSTVMLNMVDV